MDIDFSKPFHTYFIGIGGISMSGIANILLTKGFKVSGSDAHESDLTRELEGMGAKIYYDQDSCHVEDDVDVIVYTAAIRENNPEYIGMMNNKKAVHMSRADFLGLLMKNYKMPVAVSGTHGKTTTTTMLSEIFLHENLDPTLSVGGIVKSIGSNLRVGGDDYFVFEACEYTNSFLSFFPKISIILNIKEDHLDFFKDIDDIRNSFRLFANKLPEDGLLVINDEIDKLSEVVSDIKCPYVTFGLKEASDYYATDITFDEEGHPSFICHVKKSGESFPITLGVTGLHNVVNSLSAIAASLHLGLSVSGITNALKNCGGSKRRFEHKGSFNGVRVIDDYAHHPDEIVATLNAASKLKHNTLWVVFQPHTYTRTKALLPEFVKALSLADRVVLTDVYAAREKDIYGCNSLTLFEKLKEAGVTCDYFSSFDDIEKFLHKNCINGDLLITMGAGDVVKISDSITK